MGVGARPTQLRYPSDACLSWCKARTHAERMKHRCHFAPLEASCSGQGSTTCRTSPSWAPAGAWRWRATGSGSMCRRAHRNRSPASCTPTAPGAMTRGRHGLPAATTCKLYTRNKLQCIQGHATLWLLKIFKVTETCRVALKQMHTCVCSDSNTRTACFHVRLCHTRSKVFTFDRATCRGQQTQWVYQRTGLPVKHQM